MNKLPVFFAIIVLCLITFFLINKKETPKNSTQTNMNGLEDAGGLMEQPNALSIEVLRKGNYPGSDLVIEQTLEPGSNYQRYIASYKSEELKIYGLLTIPNGDPPEDGYPAIIFNHGFIPPAEYRTAERYVAYTDGFSQVGYVLFRPDYRGHDNSEGEASGAYGSNGYTVDVLNALASVKKMKEVNTNKIGMWGHSLGGFITLRAMVVSKDIKAGVIWAGVVGSYPDLLYNWRRGSNFPIPSGIPTGARRWRQELLDKYGTPEQNPTFWNSLSANSYLKDISGPVQLHHGTADISVPIEFSQKLESELKAVGKEVEFYTYPGDDHNLANSFGLVMQISVEFFDRYLK